MLTLKQPTDRVRYAAFSSAAGCDEFYITVQTRTNIPFAAALDELTDDYMRALDDAGLTDGTPVFSRLFLSDIANQKDTLRRSALFQKLTKGAVSVVEQKPVLSGPLSLLSCHLRSGATQGPFVREQMKPTADSWHNTLFLKGQAYSLLYTANGTGSGTSDTYTQTKQIFDSLAATAKRNDMMLLDNMVRTWVFVRDVDVHYGDMVRARREFFAETGLTEKTRYIASTGIQGEATSMDLLVSVDSLSISGLKPGQIVRMEAPEHLSPTILYGVTFERGLRVRFGDRSHLYISGTASINDKGEILFIGDVERQTRRTLENVRALLAPHNATLGDMAYYIVYVRNFHDREIVARVIDKELGKNSPLIFAEAPVCRPAWLVEVEGIAIIPDTSEFPAFK